MVNQPEYISRFVIGAEAPALSEKAKKQLSRKRSSKRAAKLVARVEKANVVAKKTIP